jgi:hypothetical protein
MSETAPEERYCDHAPEGDRTGRASHGQPAATSDAGVEAREEPHRNQHESRCEARRTAFAEQARDDALEG